MAKTATSRALKRPKLKQTIADGPGMAAPADLARRLTTDRLKRKLTWPAYAAFLGLKLSTVYKIARGATTKPHDLTLVQIEERLAIPTAEGAADAVVSSGQQRPE